MLAPSIKADLPSATSRLEEWTESGELLGAQAFVWHAGEVVADFAVGYSAPGRAATNRDIGRLYCAVKPLTAICLARAVAAGALRFDDRVSSFLPQLRGQRKKQITVRQLLSHTSGLPSPWIHLYESSYAEQVDRICDAEYKASYWSERTCYNLMDAWHLLAAVCEVVYGRDIASVVRAEVAAPLELSSLCLSGPDSYSRMYYSNPAGELAPLPGEPPDEVLFERVNPAHGGFGTAADLGRVHLDLLRCTSGRGRLLPQPLALEMARPHSAAVTEPQGTFGYGLGLMVGIAAGAAGNWSERCFGHLGAVPRVIVVQAAADPVHDLVAAFRFFSADARGIWRMRTLFRSVAADLLR